MEIVLLVVYLLPILAVAVLLMTLLRIARALELIASTLVQSTGHTDQNIGA